MPERPAIIKKLSEQKREEPIKIAFACMHGKGSASMADMFAYLMKRSRPNRAVEIASDGIGLSPYRKIDPNPEEKVRKADLVIFTPGFRISEEEKIVPLGAINQGLTSAEHRRAKDAAARMLAKYEINYRARSGRNVPIAEYRPELFPIAMRVKIYLKKHKII